MKQLLPGLVAGVCLLAVELHAAVHPAVPIPDRARGAQRVVVATVTAVDPVFERNMHGDELIVSRVTLRVDEVLKGTAARQMRVDIEGGTIGTLTLRVSDLPRMAPGDRAVFFMTAKSSGSSVQVPHRRGLGILKLDPTSTVQGSSMSLDDVRRAVAASLR